MKKVKYIMLLLLMLFSISSMSQMPIEGNIATKHMNEGGAADFKNLQHDEAAYEIKQFEFQNPGKSQKGYQVDLWESFESIYYPEFWTSIGENWMFEEYAFYAPVPVIDGDRFALLFGGWDESIDTLITPILDIQNGDNLSFWLGQWESGATGGNREPVDIIYGPSPDGPWTVLTTIDVSGQTMWDMIQFNVDISAAQGINYLAYAFEGYFIMDLVEGPARYYYTDDLMSVSLSGPPAVQVNTPIDFHFTIKNISSDFIAGSEYVVKLMQPPGVELVTLAGVDIQNWDEYEFTFSTSFPVEGNTEELYAVIEISTDANQANNESNHLSVQVIGNEYQYFYIGDPNTQNGSFYMPFQTIDDFNAYSEIVYWQSEWNHPAGEIIGLDYEFHWADDTENVPLTIWMAEIDNYCFQFKHMGGPDLVTSDKMYKVFEGVINVYEINGSLYIPLDNSFTYSGNGNLVILVRGLSNGPEDERIAWKSTVQGYCADNGGSPSWMYHWYWEIDPTDISLNYWPFNSGIAVPNGSFVMNTNLGALEGSVSDVSGSPIFGAKVEVDGTNLFTYTAADGTYSFTGILHGDVNVTASRYGYNDSQQLVTITTGNTSIQDFTLTSSGEVNVSGQVVKEHNGEAIEGAIVTLRYQDFTNNESSDSSSADGYFNVSVFKNLVYELEVSAIGYALYTDTVEVISSDIDLGIIELTENFLPVFHNVATSAVDSAIVTWHLPESGAKDTIVLDDDNYQGGHGFLSYTEGWVGNLFEVDGLHTIFGVEYETMGPIGDTCDDYLTIDIFNFSGELVSEGTPLYPVPWRKNYYMLQNPVTMDGNFYVMMHSHDDQNTQSWVTRWDWDGESSNYTNVIYWYDPDWPENNGFIRVYDWDPNAGTGCLVIRPIVEIEAKNMGGKAGRTITGYNVFKGETSDISNYSTWDLLNTVPVDDLEFIDMSWPPDDTVSMIYAVEAVYAAGNSNYCFSPTLKLGVPMFVSEPLTEALTGIEYVYNIEGSESRGHAIAFSANTIPDDLELVDNNDGTAVLSGIFFEAGSYDVELVVTNGIYDDVQAFTIVVEMSDFPIFLSEPDTLVGVDTNYLYEIEIFYSGTGSVTIEEGELFPDWLTLTDNGDLTGTLAGSTSEIGNYDVILEATDGIYTTLQEFVITVGAIPAFISEPITTIESGQYYEYQIEVSYNGTLPCEIIAADTLPEWLTLTDNGDNTAVLFGTAAGAESYDIVLVAQGDYFSDTQEFTLDVMVGLDELKLNDIVIYPNPTRSSINITNVQDASLIIYNSVGNIIYKTDKASLSEVIDLSNNPNGLYFIRILKDQQEEIRKVILIK